MFKLLVRVPIARAALVLFLFLAFGLGVAVPVLAAPPQETTARESARERLQTAGDIIVDPTSFSISEAAPNGSFTIALGTVPTATVTITLSRTPTSGVCNISPTSIDLNNTTPEVVTVDPIDDSVIDGSQICDITINPATSTDPDYNNVDPSDVTVTVTDDDTAGFAGLPAPITISEPSGSSNFTLELTSQPAAPVEITLTPSTGQCSVSPSPPPIELNAGNWNTGVQVTVSAVNDSTVDGPQPCDITGSVSSTDGDYNGLSFPTIDVTVNDNDTTAVQFTASNYSANEVAGTVPITVELTNLSFAPVTVDYAATSGTATAGQDFTEVSGQLTIPSNTPNASFPVEILQDTLDENPETVNLMLSNPNGADAGTPMVATLTIADDDGEPTVQFSASNYNRPENAGLEEIEVTLSAPSGRPVTVNYEISPGSATAGSDYTVTATNGQLSFPAGVQSQMIPVTILEDPYDEFNETINLSLSLTPSSHADPGSIMDATITIQDNDAEPLVSFADNAYNANENDGLETVIIELSQISEKPISVDLISNDGSATGGVDYEVINETLTLDPGDPSVTYDVVINDDVTDEGNETFTLTLSNAVNAVTNGSNPVTFTILDDENAPTVQFSNATYTVNEAGGSATVTVTLSAPSASLIPVNYATSDGSATAGQDYTARASTLFFSPGQVSRTFTVPILEDALDEGDETVNLALSIPGGSPVGPGLIMNSVLTIVDNEGPATIGFSNTAYSVSESSIVATITVQLSTASASPVTVDYATQEGTATLGDDFAESTGTLTFTPGVTSQTFEVTLLGDDIDEVDETLTLLLSNPTGAPLGTPSTATLTILDDDEALLAFASATATVSEGDGAANISVRLSVASSRVVSVTYTTVNETATAGSDYTATSGVLTFNPGETSKSIAVPIVDDEIDEDDETFAIELSAPGNAALGTPERVTVTILEVDLFRMYFMPLTFMRHAPDEPNNTCPTAYEILPSRAYKFLPDDRGDWYQFDLETSGNVRVEVTNFLPLRGQLAVYKGDICDDADGFPNDGSTGLTKVVDIGFQTAGHFYIFVGVDGPLSDTTPYDLIVRLP